MLIATHHGAWKGENRLWMEDPSKPERSDGTLELAAASIRYTWSFRSKPHQGEIALAGPPGALRADWKDSFHAENGMQLHGCLEHDVLSLYATYGAGDGPDWGWQIELDLRDPEHATLAMFNLEPSGAVHPAVWLRGAR